jgi:hypothetical protein
VGAEHIGWRSFVETGWGRIEGKGEDRGESD